MPMVYWDCHRHLKNLKKDRNKAVIKTGRLLLELPRAGCGNTCRVLSLVDIKDFIDVIKNDFASNL